MARQSAIDSPDPRETGGGSAEPTVMVFDDGSSFDYLSEIDGFDFYTCRTFEDVEGFLSEIRRGERNAPSMLALDVYCDAHEDFSLFEVDEKVDPARCGVQLYEHVLRPSGQTFASIPVLFFTSHRAKVGDLSVKRIGKRYGIDVRHCARIEFKEQLLSLAKKSGLLHSSSAALAPTGLTAGDYFNLFNVLAKEFDFTDFECCKFFGLQAGKSAQISKFLELSSMANERIELALEISVLLDRIVKLGEKRGYLEEGQQSGDKQNFDLLVAGSIQDLLAVKARIEMKLGGEIL
jgi:hypothetical protein